MARLLTATVLLGLVSGTGIGQADTVILQNDSWSGGPFSCATGWDYSEAAAAALTAPAEDYPLKITAIQLLPCGGTGPDQVSLDLFADALDSTASPDGLIWSSGSDTWLVSGVDGLTTIDLTGYDISVPSGGFRVVISLVNNDPPSVGFGYDTSGIVSHRNFVRSEVGTWTFAENSPTNYTGDFVIRAVYGTPPPRLSVGDATISEGGGTVEVPLTLSPAPTEPFTVGYSAFDGTAQAGSDFSRAAGSITFGSGQTTKMVTLRARQDSLDEPAESFFLEGYLLGQTAQGAVTITDDDSPPTLSLGNATVIETDGPAVKAKFMATISGISALPVFATFETSPESATAGSDFVMTSGVLTLAPGTTTKTIQVTVPADLTDETNETFRVTLSDLVSAVAGDLTGQGTIIDDDP